MFRAAERARMQFLRWPVAIAYYRLRWPSARSSSCITLLVWLLPRAL